MNWRKPLSCSGSTCYSEGLAWENGESLVSGIVDSISLTAGRECWYLDTDTNTIHSQHCKDAQTIKLICQRDCRPCEYQNVTYLCCESRKRSVGKGFEIMAILLALKEEFFNKINSDQNLAGLNI